MCRYIAYGTAPAGEKLLLQGPNMRAFASLAALALLAGCATTRPGTDRLAEADPLEGFNRAMWSFNQGIDTIALKPASTVYRTVTPRPARRGLSRLLANLTEPWSFINNLLQGKPDRAMHNLGRFVVNTTIGVGGLADHATKLGIKPAQEDFGQTLASWGANGGPYLVLPLLGPSTMRDSVGSGIAFFGDPYRICVKECTNLSSTQRLGITGAEFISARADLTESGADALLDTSLDPYTTAKSAFLQRRRAQILDQDDDGGAVVPDAAGGAPEDAAMDAALRDMQDEAAVQGEPQDNGADPAPEQR